MTDNHDDPEPIGDRIIRPAGDPEQPREQHIDEQFRDEWRELRAQHNRDGQQKQADPSVNVWKPGTGKSWQPAASSWPSLNEDGDPRAVTPSRQTAESADGDRQPEPKKKRRRWTFRRTLLALVVLIVLALVGWDVGVRLSGDASTAVPSQQVSASSTPKAAAVPAKVLHAALAYERLSTTAQGPKWCPMTANKTYCLKVFGTPAAYLGSFTGKPRVVSSAMVTNDDGSEPTEAAVFVGYRLDGHAQAQEDVFIIRLTDRKIVAEVKAISDDQAAAGPARLGAAILSNPDKVDGAVTW